MDFWTFILVHSCQQCRYCLKSLVHKLFSRETNPFSFPQDLKISIPFQHSSVFFYLQTTRHHQQSSLVTASSTSLLFAENMAAGTSVPVDIFSETSLLLAIFLTLDVSNILLGKVNILSVQTGTRVQNLKYIKFIILLQSEFLYRVQ